MLPAMLTATNPMMFCVNVPADGVSALLALGDALIDLARQEMTRSSGFPAQNMAKRRLPVLSDSTYST